MIVWLALSAFAIVAGWRHVLKRKDHVPRLLDATPPSPPEQQMMLEAGDLLMIERSGSVTMVRASEEYDPKNPRKRQRIMLHHIKRQVDPFDLRRLREAGIKPHGEDAPRRPWSKAVTPPSLRCWQGFTDDKCGRNMNGGCSMGCRGKL